MVNSPMPTTVSRLPETPQLASEEPLPGTQVASLSGSNLSLSIVQGKPQQRPTSAVQYPERVVSELPTPELQKRATQNSGCDEPCLRHDAPERVKDSMQNRGRDALDEPHVATKQSKNIVQYGECDAPPLRRSIRARAPPKFYDASAGI